MQESFAGKLGLPEVSERIQGLPCLQLTVKQSHSVPSVLPSSTAPMKSMFAVSGLAEKVKGRLLCTLSVLLALSSN